MFLTFFFTFNSLASNDELVMHVLYCVDDAIALPTCVSIASLLSATTEKEKFHFHFVGNLSTINLDKILSLKNSVRPFSLDFAVFNLSRLDRFNLYRTDLARLVVRKNKKIMVKYFAAEIFPDLNKILFLEDDIIVLKNIRKLFEINMEGKYVAGVDYATMWHSCSGPQKCVHWLFNCGVMLFNLDFIRKDGLERKIHENALNYQEICGKKNCCCGALDEFVLYGIVEGKYINLPFRYNIPVIQSLTRDVKKRTLFKNEASNCIVLHYLGGSWKNERSMGGEWKNRKTKFVKKAYIKIFNEHLKLTRFWPSLPPSERNDL